MYLMWYIHTYHIHDKYVYHILFIYPFMTGCVNCFCHFAIANNAVKVSAFHYRIIQKLHLQFLKVGNTLKFNIQRPKWSCFEMKILVGVCPIVRMLFGMATSNPREPGFELCLHSQFSFLLRRTLGGSRGRSKQWVSAAHMWDLVLPPSVSLSQWLLQAFWEMNLLRQGHYALAFALFFQIKGANKHVRKEK